MSLHPKFPQSPYEILHPDIRWFPADEVLRSQTYEKLLPPLVAKLRKEVYEWRERKYEGASETSKQLLNWWFCSEHYMPQADGTVSNFQYYFAQREAVETVIYLTDVFQFKDKYDLMRFDSSGVITPGMFTENWRRLVLKMATGSGKTKVLSLLTAWSYFHKLYEPESTLARNFLIITPNIIVLDRIRTDFDGLRIFFEDPVLPDNGFEGRNWQDDFQMTLHIQDNVSIVKKTGNIFLTNIHRVYESDVSAPTFEDEDLTDYFLGSKPVANTNDSKVDLAAIVRDIDELVVLNDEAHHVHDERMAWFKSIEDIDNRMKQKDSYLSLQIDVTATPKHNNGSIFAQTVSDYPLVEAIFQNVVKHPVLPDIASRAKLAEKKSAIFSERYSDYIHLGYLEWKKVYKEHKHMKKSVLFIMTDDTKNCDDVKEHLEKTYPDLRDGVLVIHTKNNGEIAENVTGKKEDELRKLREAANTIDRWDNPYKVIVSVLMLKEGWDVRNVTTIVGLRSYSAKSNILPEQTLGRGLRKMYAVGAEEYVSVVGTPAFMEFVESIQREGVDLEFRKMTAETGANAPQVIEVDKENVHKDIEKLDIEIPVLAPRIYREYKNLSQLQVTRFLEKKLPVKQFSEEEKREIIFNHIVSEEGQEIHHKTELDTSFPVDYRSVLTFFTKAIMKDLRLTSGYDVLYGLVKEFVQKNLFDTAVDLDDLNVIRNLSELEVSNTILNSFKKHINELIVQDKGEAEIQNYMKVSQARPFVTKPQESIIPKKSIFNKIVGDSHFELQFAAFLEECPDVLSYVKNYFAVHFKIDYKNADGGISDFYPDFLVKLSEKEIFIVETKGREDLDDVLKIERLEQWCEDINKAQKKIRFDYLYVKQEEYEKERVYSFNDLRKIFQQH